jgi:LAS superfamily LD-carboxypeptidase LdcB
VRLKSEKPALAATPGTSNHGWGTATDLCGGVESFGTPQHAWLATNAPLYNWFHPSWARQGGTKPEPWHFEYAG